MDIELDHRSIIRFPKEQKILVDRFREAVRGINFSIKEDKRGPKIIAKNYLYETHVMVAVPFYVELKKRTSLNFIAHTPGEDSRAFLGPKIILNSLIFDKNDNLNDSLVLVIKENWDSYVKYIEENL